MGVVTIYTDASLCPDTGACGWGAWIRSDQEIRMTGGLFRRPAVDSGRAEMAAAANGLAYAAKHGMVAKGDLVILVSDNVEVVENLFSKKSAADNPRYGAMVSVARSIAATHGFNCQPRKVKAHSSSDGRRRFINRMVDVEAKKHMLAARERIKSESLVDVASHQSKTIQAHAAAGTLSTSAPLAAFVTGQGSENSNNFSLVIENPIHIPDASDTSPLGIVFDLLERGWISRNQCKQAIKYVADHERAKAPLDFAKSCRNIGLVSAAELSSDFLGCAARISGNEFSDIFMRVNNTASDMRSAISACGFPQREETARSATNLISGWIRSTGHDGIAYERSPEGPLFVILSPEQATFENGPENTPSTIFAASAPSIA